MVTRRNLYPNILILPITWRYWVGSWSHMSNVMVSQHIELIFTDPFIASVTTNSAHSYSYFYLIPVQN